MQRTPATRLSSIKRLLPVTSADLRQVTFTKGSTVGDASHKKSRELGTILGRAAEPGENGQPRWQVAFQGGQRTTAVQQSSLDLAVVHLDNLRQPTALQQRVLVNVGSHRGMQGATKSKVGTMTAAAAAAAMATPASLSSAVLLQLLRSSNSTNLLPCRLHALLLSWATCGPSSWTTRSAASPSPRGACMHWRSRSLSKHCSPLNRSCWRQSCQCTTSSRGLLPTAATPMRPSRCGCGAPTGGCGLSSSPSSAAWKKPPTPSCSACGTSAQVRRQGGRQVQFQLVQARAALLAVRPRHLCTSL